jgi:hypothetical protein
LNHVLPREDDDSDNDDDNDADADDVDGARIILFLYETVSTMALKSHGCDERRGDLTGS